MNNIKRRAIEIKTNRALVEDNQAFVQGIQIQSMNI